MANKTFPAFGGAILYSIAHLRAFGEMVDSGHWQGVPTEGKPDLQTKEVLDLSFKVNLKRDSWVGHGEGWVDKIATEIMPSREWADEHFAERIGGKGLNPDPSHERWPWWRGQDNTTKDESGQFTHTYSERFWPRYSGDGYWDEQGSWCYYGEHGLRYKLGDYSDLLDLLRKEPWTRQAYLPIWFPEDTGAVHGGRVPCSLGYHFLLRSGRLNMWYDIRSCDAVRHFRDDLYLAVRLQHHTLMKLQEDERWADVQLGFLYFKCHSFHVHAGDYHLLGGSDDKAK